MGDGIKKKYLGDSQVEEKRITPGKKPGKGRKEKQVHKMLHRKLTTRIPPKSGGHLDCSSERKSQYFPTCDTNHIALC